MRPSRSIGKFTLHLKRLQGNMATHIFFDPLNQAEPFTVEVDNGQELRASSWDDLLYNMMKVPSSPAPNPSIIQPPMHFLQQIHNRLQPFTQNATIVIYPNQNESVLNNPLSNNFSFAYNNTNKDDENSDDDGIINTMPPTYVNAKDIIGPDNLLKETQVFKSITLF